MDRYFGADLKIFMLDSSNFHTCLNTYQDFKIFVINYLHMLTNITTSISSNDREHSFCDNDEKHDSLCHGMQDKNTGVAHVNPKDVSDSESDIRQNETRLENLIVVLNKTDKLSDKELEQLQDYVREIRNNNLSVCLLSCLTADGFTEFLHDLKTRVKDL